MSRLSLFLLGPPRVELDGEPVSIDHRKAVALLAYLALMGVPNTRDALVTLLWPEGDQSKARAGLRSALASLKSALGAGWLDVDRETVGLCPDVPIWLDVTAFQARLAEPQTHDHPSDQVCADCLTPLAAAAELYRDDFLDGFTLPDSPAFDEWQFFQIQGLRDDLAGALERLARGHAEQGGYERAITYARRWLSLDPLHEPAQRALMRLYAWSGQRAAALRQYAECERVLREELDAPPDEETQELCQAIKNNQDLPPPGTDRGMPAASQADPLHDRYRLGAELGRGGMGTVYRAHDTVLDRAVAIKVLSKAALGTEGRARLLHEARAAAGLNHPNIVSVHDAGETAGALFIVMELVEGQSLHERRPTDLDDVLSIARQICAALAHAHACGIVHRDLKPENVMLTPDGQAKLMDFGLARSIASRVTSEGTVAGTVFYLAPELALGQPFDGRADLYALGVMLYELTTGRLPFAADDPVAVISQHLHAPVVPPRARDDRVPPALDALIQRLLSKAPDDRPASAAELLAALEGPRLLERDPGPGGELSVLERIKRGYLVGREPELGEARALWTKALAGQGQTLLISGEPGIGKTRLVRELSTQVGLLGGQAVVGASYAEGGSPYDAFRQILRQVLRDLRPGDDFPLPEPVLADLLALVPELCHHYPEIAPNPPLDPQAEQQRLFENMFVFFNLLSERAPLLLVLEDAHWADSGTLSLLRHLARHTRAGRLLIVATYREVELDQARPLHELLLDLNRERLATRLKLGRLDRAQTEEMLSVLFDEEITPEFLGGIYRETEGNPFFVEEVCRALVESGKLTYKDGRWDRPSMAELGIPQGVRVAIQARVRALPAAAQETLQLAAVLGREFNFEALKMASEADEDVLIEALEDAGRAQLIEELSGERGGTFAFLHGLFASTLVESARTLQRRRLHRRAAVAIEALHTDDDAHLATLAYHYSQASEAEKATGYLLRAGDQARLLYAHQEAIDHYQGALTFLKEAAARPGAPARAHERAARTQMKLGLTYHNAFDFQRARQAYEQGFVLWERAAKARGGEPLPPAPHALRLAGGPPETLDPAMHSSLNPALPALFSGLVELRPEWNVVPEVARSWEVLESGRVYVFHLRDDWRWSDGVPVTANDFEYAWKRALNPVTEARDVEQLYDIKGAEPFHQGRATDPDQVRVRARDDFTLIVELEASTGYFLNLMAAPKALPVPRHVVEAHGAAWTEMENLVTNGPFVLDAWRRGGAICFSRNPAYPGRFRGNLQGVEHLLSIEGWADLLKAYEVDGVDLFWGFLSMPPTERERVRQRHAEEFVSGPSLATIYVAFDTRRPPFDDVRVRRAFVLTTDRKRLADVVLRSYHFPAMGGFVPPGMPGHSAGIALPYDLERGRDLLARAGYPPDGAGRPDFPVVEALCLDGFRTPFEHLLTGWRENLGVEIAWEIAEDYPTWRDRLEQDPPHMYLGAWGAVYPDPDYFLRVGMDVIRLGTSWQNDAYDRLVEQARRYVDQGQRMELYAQADRILMGEATLMPLFYLRYNFLLKPWVKVPPSPIGYWQWKDFIIEPH